MRTITSTLSAAHIIPAELLQSVYGQKLSKFTLSDIFNEWSKKTVSVTHRAYQYNASACILLYCPPDPRPVQADDLQRGDAGYISKMKRRYLDMV